MPGVLEHLDARVRADQPLELERVLDGDQDVVASPHDQRWCLQCLQTRFNGKRVPIVESREEASQIAGSLLRFDQRTQVSFDAIVTQPLGVFIRWSKGLC